MALSAAACYVRGCAVLEGGLQYHPDRVSALLTGWAGGNGALTSPALGGEGHGGTTGLSITLFSARKTAHCFMERDLGARQGEELTQVPGHLQRRCMAPSSCPNP